MERKELASEKHEIPALSARKGKSSGKAHRSSSTGAGAGGAGIGADCPLQLGPEHGARTGMGTWDPDGLASGGMGSKREEPCPGEPSIT